MSALTDLFTAMANKIRSKTGTQTTYTPSEMASDGIDDVFDAGVASVPQPTSITPSNASPVSLTANTAVKPTASGYAIASYNTKTPSNSTPVSLTSGEIDKMGGNGYAIASYSTVTPSGNPTSVSSGDIVKIDGGFNDIVVDMSDLHEIRGSNIAPEAMNGGSLAKVWGNDPTVVTGYAIASYTPVTPSSTPTSISAGDMVQVNGSGAIVDAVTSITPSNSSPVSLSSGSIYKTGGSGYAISSYSSKTPSDTSPASVSSGEIIKASAAGYLYKTLQTKGVTLLGSVTVSDTSAHTVTLSDSVKNYRYLLCSHTVYEDGQVATNPSAPSVLAFIDSDNYVSGWTINAGYVTGSSGAMTPRTSTLTYVSNTSISVKQTNSASRTYRFYGVS